MVCRPDARTVRLVPWAAEPVAVVIHDCEDWDGQPVPLSPRAVLRRVLALDEKQGWRPIVAPEMEFYLQHALGVEALIHEAGPAARRVENRVPGVDANRYLAMAATLACGWIGLRDRVQPSEPTSGSAWNVSHELPRHLEDAIPSMRACEAIGAVIGESFVDAFCAAKELEYATCTRVISSWEREHLLLLV